MTDLVQALPRRVAHVTHAVMEAQENYFGAAGVPMSVAEILPFDVEARSAASTSSALRRAAAGGLVALIGARQWIPTPEARRLQSELEDRFLADTETPAGACPADRVTT